MFVQNNHCSLFVCKGPGSRIKNILFYSLSFFFFIMKLSDFDYKLPVELIAQKPVYPRDHSKLMVINYRIEHKHFYDIIDYLEKGDVLVINETKVIPAKIIGKKISGANAYAIIQKTEGKECTCILKTKHPKIGTRLIFDKYKAEVINKKEDFFILRFEEDVNKIMENIGILPTPPYIKRILDEDEQYQTVYSEKKGSLAAPTAGLHFSKQLLAKLRKKGVKLSKVCLHVGSGTFFPVRDLKKHRMHIEYLEVDKKNADIINNRKGKLFVVGTTSVRTLESAADNKGNIIPKKGNTNLFIKPGYKFKVRIDGLITNFHLPKTTLLMLVSAFAGRKKIMEAYKIAIKNRYRLFSFGDSMFIINKNI